MRAMVSPADDASESAAMAARKEAATDSGRLAREQVARREAASPARMMFQADTFERAARKPMVALI